jgi:hypothetical protein
VAHHTDLAWVRLYIGRWLRAPVECADGTLVERTKGTPQGGVVSPLLANLFLHYAFDRWMDRNYPGVRFERYADDAIVHCRSKDEARSTGQCGYNPCGNTFCGFQQCCKDLLRKLWCLLHKSSARRMRIRAVLLWSE